MTVKKKQYFYRSALFYRGILKIKEVSVDVKNPGETPRVAYILNFMSQMIASILAEVLDGITRLWWPCNLLRE